MGFDVCEEGGVLKCLFYVVKMIGHNPGVKEMENNNMKAKELAEELLKYPNFDVKFYHFGTYGFNGERPALLCFKDIRVGDIGYSDRVITLNGELE